MTNRARCTLAIVASMTFAAPSAKADQWGCEVLLCLANPAGPTAVAQCVPPITRLWSALRRGQPFPSCEMASGPSGRAWAAPAQAGAYDVCPAGMTALAAGRLAAVGRELVPVAGIGEGDGLAPGVDGGLPPKVCVAGYRGETAVAFGAGDAMGSMSAGVYERVELVPAAASVNVIHVYIDGRLARSVRY